MRVGVPLAGPHERVAPRRPRRGRRPTRFTATRLPGPTASRGSLQALQAPDPHRRAAGRRTTSSSSTASGAAGQRAGDDRARALGREDPVDPQPGPAAVGGRRRARRAAGRARPAGRRARRRRARRPRRPRRRSRNVPATCSATSRRASSRVVVVDQADLGQRDHPVRARRAARGCAGAPRTAASSPRWRRPRTGRRRPRRRRRACS